MQSNDLGFGLDNEKRQVFIDAQVKNQQIKDLQKLVESLIIYMQHLPIEFCDDVVNSEQSLRAVDFQNQIQDFQNRAVKLGALDPRLSDYTVDDLTDDLSL
jgi:hypothetical protein